MKKQIQMQIKKESEGLFCRTLDFLNSINCASLPLIPLIPKIP